MSSILRIFCANLRVASSTESALLNTSAIGLLDMSALESTSCSNVHADDKLPISEISITN